MPKMTCRRLINSAAATSVPLALEQWRQRRRRSSRTSSSSLPTISAMRTSPATGRRRCTRRTSIGSRTGGLALPAGLCQLGSVPATTHRVDHWLRCTGFRLGLEEPLPVLARPLACRRKYRPFLLAEEVWATANHAGRQMAHGGAAEVRPVAEWRSYHFYGFRGGAIDYYAHQGQTIRTICGTTICRSARSATRPSCSAIVR